MANLLLDIGQNEIISAEIAVNLRHYIASRNPSLSPFLRANIFADSVKRIVDSRIPRFNEGLTKKLKDCLFSEIAMKSIFSIDCSDVFKAAVKIKTLGSEFFKGLNEWLSAVIKKDISRESLFNLVIQSHRFMDQRPDDSISAILDSAERSIGGLRFIEREPVALAAKHEVPGELISEQLYNNSVSEFIPPNIRYVEYLQEVTAVDRTGFFDRVSKLLLCMHPWVLVTLAFAIVMLSFVFSVGGKTDAASNTGNANSLNILAVSEPSLTSDITINDEVTAEGFSAINAHYQRMRATAYDLSIESCGKEPDHPQYGITSSGTRATVGRTIAVDPKLIPLGSRVLITFPPEYSSLDGIYIAEDTGRLIKGECIDIFFGEDAVGSREIYERAMKFGVRYVDVRVLD